MRIAVSNLAWSLVEEPRVASILAEQGVAGVEVAPTRVWPAPLEATDRDVAEYVAFWAERGIRIVALQALLFGRPELGIFGDKRTRGMTARYLAGLVCLGARLGADVLVFGSPGNRRVDGLERAAAEEIAVDFFRRIGAVAANHGVVFCIEPNPPEYGCDFVTTAGEGLALVDHVGSPGFGIHLDSGAMTLSGEDVASALRSAGPTLRHFHISEPGLAPIGSAGVDHDLFGRTLADAGYRGWVSIEMRASASALDDVRTALDVAVRSYATEGW